MGAVPQTVPRERARGPELAVFRTRANGAPFDKAVPEVDERNLVMASNRRLTKVLVGSDEWQKIKSAFACQTGTHTAYIEPNTVFDEKSLLVINDLELEKLAGTRYFVEYVDPDTRKHWLYPVHPDHLGKQNSILVSEHPNYTLHTDGDRIITLPAGMSLKEAVDLVEGFPAGNGWNRGDPKHYIPVIRLDGPELWLGRIAKRVGPARRGYGLFLRQLVLDGAPSDGLGVVVEASGAGTPLATDAPISQSSPMGLKLTQEGECKLIIEGTPAQLDAAVRLLGELRQK